MKLIVSLSLVLCLSAVAQPNPINRRAMAITGLAKTSQNFSNIFLWWHSMDLPNNVVVSNQWADRIQGVHLDQGDPAHQPTNTTGRGVYFVDTQWLTSSIPLLNYNVDPFTLVLIAEPDTHIQDSTQEQFFWGSDGDGAYFNGLQWVSGNIFEAMSGIGGQSFLDFSWPFKMVDLLYTKTNVVSGGTEVWTNGILRSGVVLSQSGVRQIGYMGRHPQANFQPDAYYNGYITDLIIWTNHTFSSLEISNIHYFATNFYGTNVIGPKGIDP